MNHFINLHRYTSVIAVFFLFQTSFSVNAAEVIRSFDSFVQVEKDGTFLVTEIITVRAEGRKIRRGIFRDFPLVFEDQDGRKKRVGFELVSVKRDGNPENSRLEYRGDTVRIYIGRKDFFLPAGIYEYTLQYETTRQLRYFDTHDEVYWNATGNFWDFPIEKATAKIKGPKGSSFEAADAFTGVVGSTERATKVARIAGKTLAKFQATRTLKPGEGLTVLAKLPKGAVNPPSDAQKSYWFWQDNKNLIIGILTLFVVTTYYFITWWRIGRDPPGGTIVPRWDIPSDMSPALMNYIDRKGLAGKGFDAISAALLNLAVKGYVTLDKEEAGYFENDTLIVTSTDQDRTARLPVGEAALLSKVVSAGGGGFKVASFNGENVKKLQSSFASAMEKEHRDRFYQHNSMAVLLGIALSVVGIFLMLVFGNFSEEEYAFLIFGGILAIFVSTFVFSLAKQFASSRSLMGKIWTVIIAGIVTFFFLSGGLLTVVLSIEIFQTHSPMVVIVIGILVLNVLFYFLLGAPTRLGRHRMDEIEGLKTYLTLAEKDRMNMADAPDFSTQHYEELLPYAVALGVEKPWSKAFESWLAAAIAAGAVAASYSPRWYRGNDFSSGSLSRTMENFSSSMQSGLSSAMPVPKSSSSGFSSGGGSSGGGGGGGGGGGW